jgi:hypothetical protein
LHKSKILAQVVLAVADSSVSGWQRGMGIPRIAQKAAGESAAFLGLGIWIRKGSSLTATIVAGIW